MQWKERNLIMIYAGLASIDDIKCYLQKKNLLHFIHCYQIIAVAPSYNFTFIFFSVRNITTENMNELVCHEPIAANKNVNFARSEKQIN